jgi:hypothetical protein
MIEGWPGTPYICTPEGRAAYKRWLAKRKAEQDEKEQGTKRA